MMDTHEARLRRRGITLEWITLAWNIVGVVILAITAYLAASVALAGFGLDSLIEIGASTVVLWELSGTGQARQRLGLRLIGGAFVALATYLFAQSSLALVFQHHAAASPGGILWTSVTTVVMFVLAAMKTRTGKALGNRVLEAEGRVTLIDGFLAAAVLLGLVLNGLFRWWWADPVAGYVIVYYAIREAHSTFTRPHSAD